MSAYVIAIISETRMNDEVREYLERIDETLALFGGEYVIHGGPYTPLEGDIAGDIVAIRFPDYERALGWYTSPEYKAIRPLRTANASGIVFLVNGVGPGHRGVDLLAPAVAPGR